MAHIFETAPSGRAKCRGCGAAIAKGEWRFGERLPNPFADEDNVEMTHWFHLKCGAFRRPEAFLDAAQALEPCAPTGEGTAPSADAPGTAAVNVPDLDALKAHAAEGVAHPRLTRINKLEHATSGRAACRSCKAAIPKDAERISLLFYEDGRFVPSGFIHLACAAEYFGTDAFRQRL